MKIFRVSIPKHSGLFYDCALVVTLLVQTAWRRLGSLSNQKGRCHLIGNLKDTLTFSFFLSYGVGVKQLLAFFKPNMVAITDA